MAQGTKGHEGRSDQQFTVVVAQLWRTLVKDLFDPYRPELHYMRGPGPKWHAKHAYVRAEAPALQAAQIPVRLAA